VTFGAFARLSFVSLKMGTTKLIQVGESGAASEVNITSFATRTSISKLGAVVLAVPRQTAMTSLPPVCVYVNFVCKLLVVLKSEVRV